MFDPWPIEVTVTLKNMIWVKIIPKYIVINNYHIGTTYIIN